MEFGLGLPGKYLWPDSDPMLIGEFASRAEKSGFSSLWTLERLLHPKVIALDPLFTLMAAAMKTQHVRLGTCILMSPLRTPVILAKEAATLDYLSGGRLILGVGFGGGKEIEKEYSICGVPIKEKVKRLVAGIEIMRKLWTGEEVNYDGYPWSFNGAVMLPRPRQTPIPVWIGGGSAESSLRRTARIADGWICSAYASASIFVERYARLKEYAREAGRDPDSLGHAKIAYTHISENREEARQILMKWMADYYRDPHFNVEKCCVFGPTQDCVRQVEEYSKAGVQTLILLPVVPNIDQVSVLANDVLSHFR